VFDSSSLIAIKSTPHADREALFQALSRLVREGRLKFPSQVVREIGHREDVLKRWISGEKAGVFDPPTFDELRRVLAVADDVIDSRKDTGEDEADPYVLATALHLRESGLDARIVTEEKNDSPISFR
jgi:hypothetical protein